MRHEDLWPQGPDFHATERININSVCETSSSLKSLPFSSKTDLFSFVCLDNSSFHTEAFVPVVRWTACCFPLFVWILSLKEEKNKQAIATQGGSAVLHMDPIQPSSS